MFPLRSFQNNFHMKHLLIATSCKYFPMTHQLCGLPPGLCFAFLYHSHYKKIRILFPISLTGQGTSVFLSPFSFQLVPHSSNGEFPRGQVCCSPHSSLSTPPWRQGTGVGCTGLAVTSLPGGKSGVSPSSSRHSSFFSSCTYRPAFHLFQPHLPLRMEFAFRRGKQGRQ